MKMLVRCAGFSAVVAAAAIIAGCGGSGGGSGGHLLGDVTGLVTDVDGSAVAGARVQNGNQQTVSLSTGTFVLPGVRSGYQTYTADATVNGHHWAGQTAVDVASNTINRTINIVISDVATQGSISGTVADTSGSPVAGAKIFIGGPIASTLATSDINGNYRADHLTSGVTYTVTASLSGFSNATHQVQVTSGQTSAASFTLGNNSGSGGLPAPANVTTQAWTIADTISRSPGNQGVYNWLKRHYRVKKGLPADASPKLVTTKATTRSSPAGSVVEVDLYWDYASFDTLFGYSVDRGTSTNNIQNVAILRDPLSHAFFDADPELTPNTNYSYIVHRLDTVDFTTNGTVGPGSAIATANPFEPIVGQVPTQGATVSGDPTFAWSPVSGAVTYQVFLFDRFPDLLSTTDPNGTVTIWNGAHSTVNAPATRAPYDGPALISGQTYYWLVVASDSATGTFAASQLAKFTER